MVHAHYTGSMRRVCEFCMVASGVSSTQLLRSTMGQSPVCWTGLEVSFPLGLIACFCVAWKLILRVSSHITPKTAAREIYWYFTGKLKWSESFFLHNPMKDCVVVRNWQHVQVFCFTLCLSWVSRFWRLSIENLIAFSHVREHCLGSAKFLDSSLLVPLFSRCCPLP